MLIMQKWLLVFGVLTPFALYGAHVVWRSLEPSVAANKVEGPEMQEMEKATKLKERIGVEAEKARKNILAAAMFEPPIDETPFKDVLAGRAWVAKNALAFDDVRQIPFVGDKGIKDRFESLRMGQGNLKKIERDLDAWFLQEVNANAKAALAAFLNICDGYRRAGAPPVKAAVYEMRGRHRIANAFSDLLVKKYDLLIGKAGLPLNQSDAKSLQEEIDELVKMFEQFALVYSAAPDQARKNPAMEGLANDMALSRDGWQACNELSKLFYIDPLELTHSDVADWFVKVGSFMSKLSPDSTRALIKQKVQQFCGAVIPEKLALDNSVRKVGGNEFAREKLKARFKSDNAANNMPLHKYLPLSLDPSGLNERTFGKDPKFTPPGFVPSMIDTPDGPVPEERFQPTPRSAASFDFCDARQQVPSDNGWKRVVLDRILEAAAESEKKPGQQWDPLSLPGRAKRPYDVLQKLKAIRAAMTNLGTQSLFPDR